MAVVIVDVPLKPRPMESDVGLAEIVKSEGMVTVKVTGVVCVAPAPVPLTVIV